LDKQYDDEDDDTRGQGRTRSTVVDAELGNIYQPDDKVPSLRKTDKRTHFNTRF
jgi:hypothetical protein